MKVLHIGGQYTVTSTIAKYQLRQGLDVSSIGLPRGDAIFQPLNGLPPEVTTTALTHMYDVIQFNQPASLRSLAASGIAPDLASSLKLIRQSGSKLILYLYGGDPLHEPDPLASTNDTKQWTRAYFDRVLLGSVECFQHMSGFDHWTWMPVPVDLELVARPPARSPKAHNLKILHLQCGVVPSDSQAIKVAALALQNHNYKFQYRALDPNQLGNVVSYYRELADCDLFIEQISQPNFGVLAIEAMAHAKTVGTLAATAGLIARR